MPKSNFTKKDLIDAVYKKINLPKSKIRLIIDIFFDSMTDIFKKNQSNTRLEIRNFGVFEVKPTKPKPKARNPKTNKIIYVPSRRKISFKAGKELSENLKKEWNGKK
ncbi:MAG: DNA-binding protein [Candidatus Marinimicrobia bacterium]|nr:DNA-binding protein [Candidatus Neomarinimicrobiota bacterium]|tara:strand:+ start:1159 stop:1479 length:321 start_codon:yes stop_codon:yes gene_type:complete